MSTPAGAGRNGAAIDFECVKGRMKIELDISETEAEHLEQTLAHTGAACRRALASDDVTALPAPERVLLEERSKALHVVHTQLKNPSR